MNLTERNSGVLLHLSSLPGKSFTGDLGDGARKFVDFLHQAGQSFWQMLPVNPVDRYYSPYSSVSAFAGEPIYIDLDALVQDGLLDEEDVAWNPPGPLQRTAFSAAKDYRNVRLKKAYERYRSRKGGEFYRTAYDRFMDENREWVMQYALFCTLAEDFKTTTWSLWPEEKIRKADPLILEQICTEREERISYYIFLQLLFNVQWKALRDYCREKRVGLIGDVPIYVGISSADTWGHPELFQLDEKGFMDRVAGVPADSFNPDGQRWNSPLYRWEAHKAENYSWWKSRIRTCLSRFDAVRLDHFIGFYNYFSMPEHVDPEDHGSWIPGPAEDFFDAILQEFPRTAFIAEDLGVLNEGVHALRNKYEFPGMNVFQFSFDFRLSEDPTEQWKETSVVCSGTHDTPTLAEWLGWVIEDRKKEEPFWNFPFMLELMKKFIPGTPQWSQRLSGLSPEHAEIMNRIHLPCSPEITRESLCWAIIQMVMNSRGRTAIFPMQDLVGLGSEARMNFPGHTGENWVWRLHPRFLTEELAQTMKDLTAAYQRLPVQ